MNKDILSQNQKKLAGSSEVLKETSLEYLREALIREEYESCADLIRSAVSYGARSSEIREVLADPLNEKGGQDPDETPGVSRRF